MNLQYGDVNEEIEKIQIKNNLHIFSLNSINLFDDMEDLVALIDSCSIIVTTSNSTAHLSGALGKTTYLLLPKSVGKFWYWHSIGQQSIWYPSVKIFKQEIDGDWSTPICNLAKFIETSIEK